MVPQNLFMLTLFGDFYYKTYIQKKKLASAKKMDTKGDKNNEDDDNNNSIPIESNNNIPIKTMANGNGITCKKNVNNYFPSDTAKANGISIS